MTKRVAIWTIAAACLALTVGRITASGNELQGCGLQTLKGSYAFRNEGWGPSQAPGQPPRVPAAFVGVMTFDGAGDGWLTNTASLDGFVARYSANGTYTVNQDCTGTLIGPDGRVGFDLVIADNGKSAFIIGVTPGFTVSGELRRQ